MFNHNKTNSTLSPELKAEAQAIEAIKKIPIQQRFQAISLNNLTFMKRNLDKQMEEEINRIMGKYSKLYKPIQQRINQIVSGEASVQQEEIVEGKQYLSNQELEKINQYVNSHAIPEYWFKVMTNCSKLNDEVYEADNYLLKKIKKIDHIAEDDTEDFSITFHFDSNDLFHNPYLSVKFFMSNDKEPKRTECSEIIWKEHGAEYFMKTINMKQTNKKTGTTKTVTKVVERETFFNFFRTIDPDDDNETEDHEELMEKLNLNLDIASIIIEEILPYHIDYFLALRTGDETNSAFEKSILEENTEYIDSSHNFSTNYGDQTMNLINQLKSPQLQPQQQKSQCNTQ